MAVDQLAQTEFLFDFGIVLLASTVSAELFKRLKLPGLLGAILAGVIIGPFAFNVVANLDVIDLLALLGSVLILFVVGLEFEASTFWEAGRPAFLLTTSGVILTLVGGYFVGLSLGWSPLASFVLGVVLSPSATSIIASLLSDAGKIDSKFGSTVLTAAVIDDVEGVILLTVALSLTAQSTAPLAIDVAQGAVYATLFVFLSILLGSKVFPLIVMKLERVTRDESLFALLLGAGLLLAFGATRVGLSALTGAFIMGAIIPARRIGERFVHRIVLMKEVFAAIFFTAIGTSFDPLLAIGLLPVIVLVLAAASASRFGGGLVGGLAGGLGWKLASLGATALVARAEMTLIIAKQAVEAGIRGTDLLVIATSVVIFSAIASVPIFRRLLTSTTIA